MTMEHLCILAVVEVIQIYTHDKILKIIYPPQKNLHETKD